MRKFLTIVNVIFFISGANAEAADEFCKDLNAIIVDSPLGFLHIAKISPECRNAAEKALADADQPDPSDKDEGTDAEDSDSDVETDSPCELQPSANVTLPGFKEGTCHISGLGTHLANYSCFKNEGEQWDWSGLVNEVKSCLPQWHTEVSKREKDRLHTEALFANFDDGVHGTFVQIIEDKGGGPMDDVPLFSFSVDEQPGRVQPAAK